jgi:hypothetical protein
MIIVKTGTEVTSATKGNKYTAIFDATKPSKGSCEPLDRC